MLADWQATGVLDRDGEHALWLYELQPADGTAATIGWLGAVALPGAGSAAVLPHEDTYPPAVEGRRALLAATATDLEPIVLAHDPEPTVAELTAVARRGVPTLELTDADGVDHRLWRVTPPAPFSRLTPAVPRPGAVVARGPPPLPPAPAHAPPAPA